MGRLGPLIRAATATSPTRGNERRYRKSLNSAESNLPYSNRGRYSACTRRRMDRACLGVLSMRPLRSRVLIIS